MLRACLTIAAVMLISQSIFGLERCDFTDPNSHACNLRYPEPKPRYKGFKSLEAFLNGVDNVMFCFSGSKDTSDRRYQSCLVFANNGVSLLHSKGTNYFDKLGMKFHPLLNKRISEEMYNFDFSSNYKSLPAYKVKDVWTLKKVTKEAGDDPDWYIKELGKCEGSYMACRKNADKFADWFGWFAYMISQKMYTACETGKPLCIKRIENLKKISDEMIRSKMGEPTGSGGGGSLSSGGNGSGGSGIATGGSRCYGFNYVCYNGRECTRRWQEQICGR
ncbi:hypothetical protein [Pseudobacteriovorax antillogorgiicola]|uniref:Uncharacterized protein n=1 Tax=Pseudobacteriovorax antillogorgiicola TaxID=1513793 RepID=A0A1Y6CD32_9BACT|nr:hypothetical protein [Pseudobacteriovorax antillogorgiicola]TCS51662.1 hypothetical protein EDD56_11046 [Pseudobacteriovorax antillogorgiicola]SMF48921.1 hypothetical protein SAMN06296036_11515 [Pseudobacteriovorax antillogorgiicola]